MKSLLVMFVSLTVGIAICVGSESDGLEGSQYELAFDGNGVVIVEFGSDRELRIQNEPDIMRYEVDEDGIHLFLELSDIDETFEMVLTYDDIEAQVISGEIKEFNLMGENRPAGADLYLDGLINSLIGTHYTLTKIED